MHDAPEEALAVLRRAYDDPACADARGMASIARWAAYFGDSKLAVSALRKTFEANTTVGVFTLWSPS
jgi:hypothetical protein